MDRTRASADRGSRSRRSDRGRRSRRRPAVGLGRRRRPRTPHQDADQPRLRRRGHLGGPGGVPDRPASAQARRQRGRRGRRDRGGARRDRALQLRSRRRRLLRLLRRQDRQGPHHRRPRDRAARRCRTTRSSTSPPASPTTSPPSWSPAASPSASPAPRPPGPRRCASGAPTSSTRPSSPPRSWPAAASSSTRRSASRRWTTRSGSRPTPAPRGCSCPAATPRDRGSVFRNPALARTYDALGRKRGVSWFYNGPIADEIAANVRTPPKSPSTDLPVPAGFMTAARPGPLPRAVPRPDPRGLPRATASTAWRGSSSGGTTVGEALNIMERFPLRRLTHHPAAARLPRGQRARVRRPGEVPRRPGLRERPARHPALRPVRRVAGLLDQPDLGDVQAHDRRRREVLRPDLRRHRVVRHRGPAGHRERRDHQPDGHRQVGQRRGVHPDHRADRRLRPAAARSRVPAEQRADRLLRRRTTRPTRTGSSPASGRAPRSRRRSSCATASRSWPWAHPAARRSSPPCCR